MTDSKNVNGHYYPQFDTGWGSFAEELFHYTSRYYFATEAFLRSLVHDNSFMMRGYKAAQLSSEQRDLLAAVLSCAPDEASAAVVISIVEKVQRKDPSIDAEALEQYGDRLNCEHQNEAADRRTHATVQQDVSSLDPFLNLAERLQIPVAVCDHHVDVSLHALAEHLQSPNSALRTNLHNAIIGLHSAGYVLRNHPNLTHSEARDISDDGVI